MYFGTTNNKITNTFWESQNSICILGLQITKITNTFWDVTKSLMFFW